MTRPSGVGRALALLACASLAGCHSTHDADIVLTTRHCSPVLLAPDLRMLKSIYEQGKGIGSVRESLVYACDPIGAGCHVLLRFHHALGPRYTLRPDGSLVITILGGTIDQRFSESLRTRSGVHKIEVRQIMGKVERKEIERFLDSLPHRCPGEGKPLIL